MFAIILLPNKGMKYIILKYFETLTDLQKKKHNWIISINIFLLIQFKTSKITVTIRN